MRPLPLLSIVAFIPKEVIYQPNSFYIGFLFLDGTKLGKFTGGNFFLNI